MSSSKNILMLAILSAGLFAVLTGVNISVPAFADKDECEDNGDDSCDGQSQKTNLKNDCKVSNDVKFEDNTDDSSNDNSITADVRCSVFGQTVDEGNALIGDGDESPDGGSDSTGTLIVTKQVSCPTAECPISPGDFAIQVAGDVQPPSSNSFQGDPSGTEVILGPGNYLVQEIDLPPGIAASFSEECTGLISAGETKNCEVLNTLVPE
jgi:hypothetical protein